MVAKIRPGVDTRRDGDLLIIARTDAIAPEGYAAAIERAGAYREAGADVTFVEGPTAIDAIADIPRPVPSAQLIHIVIRGRPPALAHAQAQRIGPCPEIFNQGAAP